MPQDIVKGILTKESSVYNDTTLIPADSGTLFIIATDNDVDITLPNPKDMIGGSIGFQNDGDGETALIGTVGAGSAYGVSPGQRVVLIAMDSGFEVSGGDSGSSTVNEADDFILGPKHDGKTVILNVASPCEITVPNNLPLGFNCLVVQKGAGAAEFVDDGDSTVVNRESKFTTAGQYALASVTVIDVDDVVAVVGGDLTA